jgi:hypothetical protein
LDAAASRARYGAQQKEVAPEGVAVPVGAPPPATPQVPGVNVMFAVSLTSSTVLMGAQALGASNVVPSSQLSMAGVETMQVAPEDGEHWQAVHPRWSATPE